MSKMKLLLGITICCFTLHVKSQRFLIQPAYTENPSVNPDQLYFTDNRPNIVNNVIQNREKSQANPPSGDLQPPFKEQIDPGYTVAQTQSILGGTGQFEDPLGAIANFSLNVLKNIVELKPGNVVVSPYSVASILSLLQQGASGEALHQITTALHMTPALSAATYKANNEDFQQRNTRNILKSVNNLFVADAFSLNDQFKLIAKSDFKSEVTATNFENPVQAAQKINDWVASNTNHKIDKLLSPDSIGVNTQLVLVNAIYFKGLWDTKFRPEATKPNMFILGNGTTKTAQFMRARRYYKTGVDQYTSSKVVVIPFEHEQYSLMIILPTQLISVSEAIASLTISQLAGYQKFPHLDTQLELPKFTVRADTDLVPVLNKMGITKIFSRNSELTNIGTYRTYSPQVSSAVHSAVLTIDEEGGSAAAASAFAVVALSYDEPSVNIKINRPFIAVIWDNTTQLPLFMAKIEDPIA